MRTVDPAQLVDASTASKQVSVAARTVPEPVTLKMKFPVEPPVTPVTSRLNAAVIVPVNVVGLVNVTPTGDVTVKQPVHVLAWLSVFVTVKSRAPVVAAGAMLMFAVRWLVSTNVVEFTVMPVPENETVAPGKKFAPRIEMFLFVVPWGLPDGVAELVPGA